MSGIEASIDCALDLCDQLHELKTVVSGAAGMIAATGDNCSTDTVTAAAWMLDQVAEKIGGGVYPGRFYNYEPTGDDRKGTVLTAHKGVRMSRVTAA